MRLTLLHKVRCALFDRAPLRTDVIQQIICHGTVDSGATEASHGIDFDRPP
jgi:hypothetical protein